MHKLFHVVLLKSLRRYYSFIFMSSFLFTDKHYKHHVISLVKNLNSISRLNIHYYPNRRYKSYITSLKAVIVGKSFISAGLDIDIILYFVFYDEILQSYQQNWVRKFYRHILSRCRQISKKWAGVLHTSHSSLDMPLVTMHLSDRIFDMMYETKVSLSPGLVYPLSYLIKSEQICKTINISWRLVSLHFTAD